MYFNKEFQNIDYKSGLARKGGLVSVEMNEPSYWLDLNGNNDLNDC